MSEPFKLIMPESLSQVVCCAGCGNEIDPDCCGCGEMREGHNPWNAGHAFVPMGCDCMRCSTTSGGEKS